MKNILYISNLNIDKQTGVTKKILSQIEAFKELGNKVSYIQLKDKKIYFISDNKEKLIKKVSKNKVIKELQIIYEYIKIIKLYDFDFIYIRKFLANPIYIKMLKEAKNKKIKIVEETPTYPYDSEMFRSKNILLIFTCLVDKIYRKKLKKYVDRISTFSDHEVIYDIKTIIIENGIDLEKNTPININISKKEINIIAVAAMEYWQGYDRLIKSLSNYYTNKKHDEPEIILNLVGEGNSIKKLKKLAITKDVSNKVIFHGFLSGKKLDEIYNKCQLAVATLGLNRKKMDKCSSLKVKEYTAKAIPFIYSAEENYLSEAKYCFKVENDESIFDMRKIIEFLYGLDIKTLQNDMRNFALNHYTWKKSMKKVLDSIYTERNL